MRERRLALWGVLVLMLGGCATAPGPAPVSSWVIVIDDPMSSEGMSGADYSARTAGADAVDVHALAMALADEHGVTVTGDWPLNRLGLYCIAIADTDAATRAAIARDPRVHWVQRMTRHDLRSAPASSPPASQSMLQDFMSDVEHRGHGVTIAVIDTDVDESHPDLAGSRLTVSNFAGDRGMPMKEQHGTAVVGLISATAARPDGLTGVAHAADVHLLRACWEQAPGVGECNTVTLARALNAAIDLEPDIVNLSLSGARDPLLDRLVKALIANGALVVAAFDDHRGPTDRFPTARPGIIYAVGAEQTGVPPGSNVIIAPRHAVSIAPMAGYQVVSGHSFAAPIVSAMAACLKHRYPNASAGDITVRVQTWLNRYAAQRDRRH